MKIHNILIFALFTFVVAHNAPAQSHAAKTKPVSSANKAGTEAAPANDSFAGAMPLTLSAGVATVSASNTDATKESGEPRHAENDGGKSVWFSFTPLTTTAARILTSNMNFDTTLGVYTGTSVSALTLIGNNDDCSSTCAAASSVDLMLIGGQTYYIAVDGMDYADGNGASSGTFKLVIADGVTPPQNSFAAAYDLGFSHSGSIAGTNYGATLEPDEPSAYTNNANGKSVWYRWKPSATYSAAIELTENFDSQLGIYTSDQAQPTLADLTLVVPSVDYVGFTDRKYRATFLAESGKTYYIKVDWHTLGQNDVPAGNFQLKYYPNKLRYSAQYSRYVQRTSISVFRPSEGNWYTLTYLPDLTPFYRHWGQSADIPVPADYDGNGGTDNAVVRNSGGKMIWYVGNGGISFSQVFQWGLTTDKVITGDFDLDGRADAVAIRESGQSLIWYVRRSSDGALRTFVYGILGDKPVLGDFDGDGGTDLALLRNTAAGWVWHLLQSNMNSFDQYRGLQFGLTSDIPVVEDYDGDGKSDVAVFRPSTGVWYVLNSGDGQIQATQFGAFGDTPQPGDYNGDGKADPAVFRPTESVWYIAKPTGIPAQSFHAIPWGASTDKPISSMTSLW